MYSTDSQYLCSNSKDAQILYWRTGNGERQMSQEMFRDTDWGASNWCNILGWPVIGVWDRKYDLTDVNAVAQYKQYLVSADDEGAIRLFRFPAPYKDQAYKEVKGHGSHVTNVRWHDGTLVSLGGDDRSIIQWHLKREEVSVKAPGKVDYPWIADAQDSSIEAKLGRHLPADDPRNLTQTQTFASDFQTEFLPQNTATDFQSIEEQVHVQPTPKPRGLTPAAQRCRQIARGKY